MISSIFFESSNIDNFNNNDADNNDNMAVGSGVWGPLVFGVGNNNNVVNPFDVTRGSRGQSD